MGKKGYGGGGRGRVCTYRYTVTTRTTCIKMGRDESRFNVSLIVRDKVTRPCPQATTFEDKGEPRRYRTEVFPLTSPLGQTGSYHLCEDHGPLYTYRSMVNACDVTLRALLQNKSAVCSGSRVASSTVMKLHGLITGVGLP